MLAFSATGSAATRAAEVSRKMMTSTFSLTSFSQTWRAVLGSVASSATFSSSLPPSTPPAALTSSTASGAACRPASPKMLAGPLSSVTKPMVAPFLACASAGVDGAAAIAAAARIMAAASRGRTELCFIEWGSPLLSLTSLTRADDPRAALDLVDDAVGRSHHAIDAVEDLERQALMLRAHRCTAILDQDDVVAPVAGVAHRGLDAVVGDHAGHDQGLDAE